MENSTASTDNNTQHDVQQPLTSEQRLQLIKDKQAETQKAFKAQQEEARLARLAASDLQGAYLIENETQLAELELIDFDELPTMVKAKKGGKERNEHINGYLSGYAHQICLVAHNKGFAAALHCLDEALHTLECKGEDKERKKWTNAFLTVFKRNALKRNLKFDVKCRNDEAFGRLDPAYKHEITLFDYAADEARKDKEKDAKKEASEKALKEGAIAELALQKDLTVEQLEKAVFVPEDEASKFLFLVEHFKTLTPEHQNLMLDIVTDGLV
jgi:hypothetical protein